MEHAQVEGIPVAWHGSATAPRGLALWLTHLGGSIERTEPMLEQLADNGFLALTFDPPGHGRRGTGDPWQFADAVLGSFRQRMWPLLGQTTLECLRVLDWAQARFSMPGRVVAGGVSMGGDVTVAWAGIDPRVHRVSALVATPDWTRPHMHALGDATSLVDQGVADAYSQWYFDALNPMTHLDGYRREVAICFHSGGSDHHVPAADAMAFRAALVRLDASAAGRIRTRVEPEAGHLDVDERFYDAAVSWLRAGDYQ